MKSRYILLPLFLLFAVPAMAQKMEGVITYEKVYHWVRLNARLTFLSNEEKERMKMTYAGKDEFKRSMVLYFNENQSYYTFSEERDPEQRYSWRDEEFRIYRNFATEKKTDIIEMLGKTYIVDDSLKVPKWKVMNKIREIGGYMCMMAVTEDTIKKNKITTWFANNFPIPVGPELFSGLPGAILELDYNDGDIVITAKKIDLRPVTEDMNVPKKIKGKKITNNEYDQLIWTHIRDSQKAQRNPYWTMPY
jgi:GLPGLI family protein